MRLLERGLAVADLAIMTRALMGERHVSAAPLKHT
jgi:hypothetical protein